MTTKGEWIRYGEGSGYFARPESAAARLPGVLVIQEIGGVNDNIMDVTRRIAAEGYAALAPDLFAVNGKRPDSLTSERIREAFGFAAKLPPGTMFDRATREAELGKLAETDRQRISQTYTEMFTFAAPDRMGSLMGPLVQAFRHLHEKRAETRGQKIGCVGFCMGGGLAALLACEEPELSGAAVFYGMTPPAEKIAGIRCPVIAFYGEKDQRVNTGIPAFQEAMRAAGNSFTHHMYEGAGHAFFNNEAPSYNQDAARDAYARLLAFFTRELSG